MNKKLKICAIMDIIIDIVLVVSLICISNQKSNLKQENQKLNQIIQEQTDQLLQNETYIEYLENIVIEVEPELYSGK